MYECEDCGYVTNKKFNFMKHKNRKTVCKRSIKIENGTEQNLNTEESNLIINGENLKDTGENLISIQENSNSIISVFKCSKCRKILSCKKSLKSHELICKGVPTKTCPTCFKQFNTDQAKYYHMKFVKCSPPSKFPIEESNLERNSTNISNTLINGNNNNTNVQNITINKI